MQRLGDRGLDLGVGDVTCDGRPEVVVLGLPEFDVYRQRSDGWFGAPMPHSLTRWSSGGIEVADADGDGRSDVLVGIGREVDDSAIETWTQTSTGDLTRTALDPSHADPRDIVVADLSGDGRPDVATLHSAGSAIGLFLRTPEGALASENAYTSDGSHGWLELLRQEPWQPQPAHYFSHTPKGRVLAQRPAAWKRLANGASVRVVVSRGPRVRR